MKKAFFLLVSVIAFLSLKANTIQTDTPYKKQPDLNKYVGTWEYAENGVFFSIVLKKEKVYSEANKIYIDFLQGYHLYRKDGKIIQNSIGKSESIFVGRVFYDVIKHTAVPDEIEFNFVDMERDETERGGLKFLPGNKLRWTVKNHEAFHYSKKGEKPGARSVHVPNNIILTKVE